MKSPQKLFNDLIEIIDLPINIDRYFPLVKMVAPGILRSLPAVEMTEVGKVEMTEVGKVELPVEVMFQIEMNFASHYHSYLTTYQREELDQVEQDFVPFSLFAPTVVISTAERNLRMVKSHALSAYLLFIPNDKQER